MLSRFTPRTVATAVALLAVVALAVWFGIRTFAAQDDGESRAGEVSAEATATADATPGAAESVPGSAAGAPSPTDPFGEARRPGEQIAGQPGSTAPGGSSAPEPPPTSPAASGEQLRRITTPPEKSIWALSPDSYDAGTAVAIEFKPYGTGPDSLGPSVVARVDSAKPADASARVPDLEGRNVVLVLGDSTITSGGRYAANAVMKQQGDRIVFVLEKVRPLSE